MDKESQNLFEFQTLDEEQSKEVEERYKGAVTEFILVGPKKYFLPKAYLNHAAAIFNMPVRPSDNFVITYQRSGTTMTQEMVWLLVNDFDYEAAKSTAMAQRYPFLEFPIFLDECALQMIAGRIGDADKARELLKDFDRLPIEIIAEAPDPRFIKSHLPLSLLPSTLLETAKVVYVARDPRDVAVSSYHHSQFFIHLGLQGDFKQFWNVFRKGLFWYTPYFEHVKEAWAQRNHPNMLFLFYEDLRKDLSTNIRRIATFFGKNPTEEQINRLCDHLNIDNFKHNKSVNMEDLRLKGMLSEKERFIRNGKTGGWRDYFDEEMIKQAESWISENLKDTDLRFPSMQDIVI